MWIEPEDYRKWYACPKCNSYWTNEGYEEDEFEISLEGEELKDLTVLRIDDGKEIWYRKYPKNLCPSCGEIIIDGRLKGPLIKAAPVKEEDFKCQVCGSEDLDSKPFWGNSFQIYLYVCSYCNSYNYADLEDYNDEDPVNVWYREDLTTRQFKETLSICVDIMKSKGTLIKKGSRRTKSNRKMRTVVEKKITV